MAEIAPFAGVLAKDLENLPAKDVARDPSPAIYRCHQVFEHQGRTVTRKGFIARTRLTPFSDGFVMPHAHAQAATIAERLQRMRTARAHPAPSLGLYGDRQHRIDDLFEELERWPPALEGATSDGTLHRVWRLTDEKTQARVASILSPERIYLGEGQPEYEAMLALRDELGAAPEGSQHWGSMFFCNLDDPGLIVVPTHRVLHGLPSFDRAALLSRARDFFVVAEGPLSGPDAVRPALLGQSKRGPAFAVVTPGIPKIAYLRLRPDLIKASMPQLAESRSLGELDVTHLHGLIYDEILGLDRAAQERHLRYERDWDRAFSELSSPGTQALFLMNPMRLDLFCAVLDEGRVMPERSTWFPPEIPAGLVSHLIDPAETVRPPPS